MATKAQLRALERVFAAEIEGRLPFQGKARIYNELCGDGLLEPMARSLDGKFAVIVKGYQLTHLGRLTYCMSCDEDAD